MNLIDCNNLLVDKTRGYGGLTGSKIAVHYDDSIWMLKCGENLKIKEFKNIEISYANDPITEYIGSHIYSIFGFPVHETVLGIYHNKLCVLCKDLAYPYTIVEFRTIRNMIMDDNVTQPSSGMSLNLNDIFETIQHSDAIDREGATKRFWQMFVIDALIGNADRNNGNWGFLAKNGKLELCPVYDCGGCLNNKRSDSQMNNDIQTGSIKNLAFNYLYIFTDNKGKRINPFHYMEKNPNETIIETLNLFTKDKLVSMLELIDSLVPIISDIRVEWYKEMLSLRFNHLVELRDKLFNKEDYLKEYLGILPPASVEACVTKEDCDSLLERLGIR